MTWAHSGLQRGHSPPDGPLKARKSPDGGKWQAGRLGETAPEAGEFRETSLAATEKASATLVQSIPSTIPKILPGSPPIPNPSIPLIDPIGSPCPADRSHDRNHAHPHGAGDQPESATAPQHASLEWVNINVDPAAWSSRAKSGDPRNGRRGHGAR